ncbi:hypothetical protein U4E84_11840 [Halorubrum sp. AD140]|uniref:DUF7269 family protein n=1 Tax=Halorubrum sp. AD140 TaxID=3050073 RepID=UPI002ACC830F|nr:hypothetical protein [Halorubrum sp. AD140]MDZ5812033.1 hypothetical protein [Halorubrum sp. AD140]
MVRPLVAVGVAAVAVGFLAVLDRGVAAALDPSSTVVTLIGALGVLQGVRYANTRRTRDRQAADPGEPERREPAHVPGADIDEQIEQTAAATVGGYGTKRDLRGRVRDVAVASVARERNCSVEEAERLVDDGEWTDDATAAAFLSRDASYPIRVRLRTTLSGRSRYGVGLRASLDAIARSERTEADGNRGDVATGVRDPRPTATEAER